MEITAGFILGAVFIGALIGVLTGIFGVGGGFMLTPLLMICMGVSGPVAVGTGLAVILVNSTYGLYKRRGSGTIDVKISVIISIGSLVGVLIGSKLLNLLSNAPKIEVLGREQDTVQYVLLLAFLLLLGWIAGYLSYDYCKHCGKAPAVRVGLFSKWHIPPVGMFKSLEEPHLSIPLLVVFGLVVGILTGLLGVGGGVILLPALVYLVGQRTVKAAGTSLLLVWISSLAAVIKKGTGGDIDLLLAAALLAGGFLGTELGTKLGLKFEGPKIRLYFIYIVIVAALLVAYKLLVLTFGTAG
jgi:uncharacterized membrane protein YfcA